MNNGVTTAARIFNSPAPKENQASELPTEAAVIFDFLPTTRIPYRILHVTEEQVDECLLDSLEMLRDDNLTDPDNEMKGPEESNKIDYKSREDLEAHFRKFGHEGLIAISQTGDVIGACLLSREPPLKYKFDNAVGYSQPDDASLALRINFLVTSSALAGNQIGMNLLRVTEKVAKSQGVSELHAGTRLHNAEAIELFAKKAGYVADGMYSNARDRATVLIWTKYMDIGPPKFDEKQGWERSISDPVQEEGVLLDQICNQGMVVAWHGMMDGLVTYPAVHVNGVAKKPPPSMFPPDEDPPFRPLPRAGTAPESLPEHTGS